MIRKYRNYNGFPALSVFPESGGSISILNFGGTTDIGLFSSTNKHGLGGSHYIRDKGDVANKIEMVKRTIWLSEEEKNACVDFLLAIRTQK
jgi:hypothetical protein